MKIFFLSIKILLFCLVCNTNIQAQEEVDTTLMRVILQTLSSNKEITPYISFRKGSAARSSSKFQDGLRELELSIDEDLNSTIPMLMINRLDGYWLETLSKMGAERNGILRDENFELYYMTKIFFWAAATPVLIKIDSIFSSPNQYVLEFRTIKTGWFSFAMTNSPSHFYKFKVKFKKEKESWIVEKVKRKKLTLYTQNLKK